VNGQGPREALFYGRSPAVADARTYAAKLMRGNFIMQGEYRGGGLGKV
jgi:hypothetical protein